MYDYFSGIVKHEAEACARRHNLNPEDVLSVFQKLDAAQWYEPKYPQFTAFDLSLKYLDGKKAVELFTGSDIEILRKRVSICDYLNHPLIPFYNIDELSELLDTFSGYLSDNKDSLLKTGYPKAPFQNSPWLESKLGGLLCTKIPMYHPCDIHRKNMFQIAAVVSVHEENMYTSLKKDPKGNWVYSYIWDRHPEFTEVKPHVIEDSGLLIQYLSSNDSCENYSDAGSLPFIPDEDVLTAEKHRSQLLELKIQSIKLLLTTLKNGDVWNLWNRWLSIAGELCDPEMITFLLKMDNYHNKPRYWFSETCSNSGLLGILYILTHCEKELKYGSLRRMKDAFLSLPKTLFSNADFSYYEFVGEECQPAIDKSLDKYVLWEEDENTFWEEIDQRTEKGLNSLCEGYSPVHLEEWVKTEYRSIFSRNVRSYAQWQKENVETTGQLAPLQVTASQQHQSEENLGTQANIVHNETRPGPAEQSSIKTSYYANIQRILKYLLAEFKKIRDYNSEIFYTKAVVSEEDDIRVLWHRYFWYRKKTEDITVWPNYTVYAHEEYRRIYGPIHFPGNSGGEIKDLAPYPPELEIQPADEDDQEEKPQTIAYGTLSGTNIIDGEVLIKPAIEKAIKFLLLMHYYPQRMPDSDTFFEWFPHFASQADVFKSSVRFDEDEDIVYWYEFLLKLSLEHGSLIGGDKPRKWVFSNMAFEPLVQKLETDILQASILALEFLLEKAKSKTVEKETSDALLETAGQFVPIQAQTECNLNFDKNEGYDDPKYGWSNKITPAKILEVLPHIFESISADLSSLTTQDLDSLINCPKDDPEYFNDNVYKTIYEEAVEEHILSYIEVIHMISQCNDYDLPCKMPKIQEYFDDTEIFAVIVEAFDVVDLIYDAGELFLADYERFFPDHNQYPRRKLAKKPNYEAIVQSFYKYRKTIEGSGSEDQLKELAWKIRAYKKLLFSPTKPEIKNKQTTETQFTQTVFSSTNANKMELSIQESSMIEQIINELWNFNNLLRRSSRSIEKLHDKWCDTGDDKLSESVFRRFNKLIDKINSLLTIVKKTPLAEKNEYTNWNITESLEKIRQQLVESSQKAFVQQKKWEDVKDSDNYIEHCMEILNNGIYIADEYWGDENLSTELLCLDNNLLREKNILQKNRHQPTADTLKSNELVNDAIEIDLKNFSDDHNKPYDFKQELRTFESQRYIKFNSKAEATKAARRIRSRLKNTTVVIKQKGKILRLKEDQRIKLKDS